MFIIKRVKLREEIKILGVDIKTLKNGFERINTEIMKFFFLQKNEYQRGQRVNSIE